MTITSRLPHQQWWRWLAGSWHFHELPTARAGWRRMWAFLELTSLSWRGAQLS